MLFLFKKVNIYTKSAYVYSKAKKISVNFVRNKSEDKIFDSFVDKKNDIFINGLSEALV
jgi:hypothetical protein